MYLKSIFSFLLALIGILSIISCEKESDPELECNKKYYIPENQLSWFPYFSLGGDTILNQYFQLESQAYFLNRQEIEFLNESLDTQNWSLTYVIDKFKKQLYYGCPLYQEIKYTIYNWEIAQHMDFGFVQRDTNFPSRENLDPYIPMINFGACTTKHENSEGILGGTCYSTAFDIYNFSSNHRIEHLNIFDTQFATYEDVFLIKLDHNPDPTLDYDIYIARDFGIVAYKNQDIVWSLK